MKNLMKYMMIMAIAILASLNITNGKWIYEMICSDNDHNFPKFLDGKRLEIYDVYIRYIDTLNLENDPLSPFDGFTHPFLIKRPFSKYLVDQYGILVFKISTKDIPIDILNKFPIQDTMPEFKYILIKTCGGYAVGVDEKIKNENFKSILILFSNGNYGNLVSYLGIYNEDEIKIIKNAKDKKEIENILINNPYILSIY